MEHNKEKWLKKQVDRFRKLSFKNMLKSDKSHKWIRVGLLWGLFMYLSTVILFPLFAEEKISMVKILIGMPLWVVGGLFWGYSVNNLNKSDASKENIDNE